MVHIFNKLVKWILRLELETTAFSPAVRVTWGDKYTKGTKVVQLFRTQFGQWWASILGCFVPHLTQRSSRVESQGPAPA